MMKKVRGIKSLWKSQSITCEKKNLNKQLAIYASVWTWGLQTKTLKKKITTL